MMRTCTCAPVPGQAAAIRPSCVPLPGPGREKRPAAETAARISIRIDSLDGRKSRFTLSVPVQMLSVGLAIARGFSRMLACLSVDELQARLQARRVGLLWAACDESSDERLQIYAERPQLN